MDDPKQEKLNKIIDQRALEVFKNYLKSGGFTDRKLTDTPTDGLMVVNRNYVTNNGASASRPRASVIGQPYFDTTLGKPVWWRGDAFVDGGGTVV